MGRHRITDDGSITLETVIAFPVAMLAVLLTINAALWYHARNTALAAAQEGVRTGHADQSRATAFSFARTVGNGFLLSPRVDTSGTNATTVVVRVQGRAVSLIPGLHLSIDQVARGPVERFTTPSGSGGTGGR
jgi:TadE-like protein